MINFARIAAALLVVLALVLGVYAWTLGRQSNSPTAAERAALTKEANKTHPVVVTTKPIPAGEPITADALRVAQLPLSLGGAVSETASAVGRVPITDLGEGAPVLENQLVAGLALRIKAGERAVAVKADEAMGVGNRVRPGDLVDVFFVLKDDGKEIDRSQARLLLARKRVLAFGNASLETTPPSANGGKAVTHNATPPGARADAARTAVLAVDIDEVNRLALGEASGRLLLALRNPEDSAEPDPALFAELPAVLRPIPGAAQGSPPQLHGMDRAYAGLAKVDLVNGGTSTAGRPAPTTPNAASVPRLRSPAAHGGGTEVEFFRGDRRETLRY